ncbi:MAG: cupin domain-containing protein [Hyphomicrobiaceae bacterium]
MRAVATTLVLLAFGITACPAAAQQATPPPITQGAGAIKRTPLQRFEVPGTSHETVTAIADIGPNIASIGRHTHPGPETGYIIEGEVTLLIEGQPPREVKAGDSYVVPAGVVHDARTGPKGAKVMAVYVVEKGKPLATAAK